MHEPEYRNKFSIQQDNNAIVHISVDEIILQDKIKLSVQDKAHDNIDSEVD